MHLLKIFTVISSIISVFSQNKSDNCFQVDNKISIEMYDTSKIDTKNLDKLEIKISESDDLKCRFF